MKNTQENLYTALRIIKKECEEYEKCDECPMYSKNDGCLVNKTKPENWHINDPYIWRAFKD